MDKDNTTFRDWFAFIQKKVKQNTGVPVNDEDAFREDYDNGRLAEDVAAEMTEEYNRT